ncbi:MAG: GNVR domain-containing protein, partial [Kiritimatiellae bacterium]|nr:GNVR domain-containing protein [Kiritimatiellia bacterium]
LTMAVLYLMTATKYYEATTVIELSVRRPRISGNQGAIIDDSRNYRSEEVFNTHLERLKGDSMYELAADVFLAEKPDLDMTRAELKKWLKRQSEFSLVRRSQLMKVSFEDPDPEIAALGANMLGRAAEVLAFQENRNDSEKAVGWLTDQAVHQKANLEKVDQALLMLRAENNIDVLETQRRTIADAMLDYNKTLVGIESEAVLARDLHNLLKKNAADPEKSGQLPPSTPRLEEIRSAMDTWIISQSELHALRSRYTDKHPKVKAKLEESAANRAQAVSAIQRSIQSAESNLKLLEQQAVSLKEKVEEERRKASELEMRIVTVQTRLASLQREKDAADISYKGILNRMEEARLSADETTTSIKVVDKAVVPTAPSKPRRLRVLVLMLGIGVLFGFGLALFADALEDHITSSLDIEQNLGLKVLGLVPRVVDVGERRDMARISQTDKFSQVAEAFAGVRAILDSAQYKDVSQSILVASTMPEEGKTIAS